MNKNDSKPNAIDDGAKSTDAAIDQPKVTAADIFNGAAEYPIPANARPVGMGDGADESVTASVDNTARNWRATTPPRTGKVPAV